MLNLGLLITASIYLAWNNHRIGGQPLMIAGIASSGKFLLGIMPIIVVFSLLAGQIATYYRARPAHVREIVSGKSIVKAAIAGTCTPGGTTIGPVLQQEWQNGGNKLAIMACFLAISLLNWTTLLFRLPFFGARLTAIVFGVGLLITSIGVGVLLLIQKLSAVT
ncbi:MAG: hypothetical protein KGI45_03720 [Patescibacteria group bacterium]|nr:hypothetical protein [Patescibacteria group bacterium]MDE1967151.1 hypothetical protein [Patescibacteria group bacterium]